MPNYKLILEYDGTHFQGWHPQHNQTSIYEELLKSLNIILSQGVDAIYASGRTDAGVHAVGQVANFHYPDELDLSSIALGLSSLLRGKLAVVRAEKVSDDFHARFSALNKTYSYQILNRPAPPVLLANRCWHVPIKLDLLRMENESRCLIGENDFTSFRASNCGAKNPIKIINFIEFAKVGDLLTIRINGNGFLKQMVRNIVGTLVDFGSHNARFSDLQMSTILKAKDRRQAGRTAPPEGLTLEEVSY